jgi:P27 family predicted phage terminase small subunit
MGLRGFQPQPTALRILRGNPGKRALPKNEIQPIFCAGIPSAPEWLPPYAKEEWDRICKQLLPLGLLSELDFGPLAAYCEAYSRWRIAVEALRKMGENEELTKALLLKKNGLPIQNPLAVICSKAGAEMVRYAGEFGMSPAARASIAATPVGEVPNKFDGLLAG